MVENNITQTLLEAVGEPVQEGGDEKWFYFSVLLVLFIGLLQVMREMEKAKKHKLKKLKKMISANEQKEKLRQRDQEILKQIDDIKSQQNFLEQQRQQSKEAR